MNQTGTERAETMQRHNETDEVFVLLNGKCVLFIASDSEKPENPSGELMEPLKIYNVPKGYWHAHVLEDMASVLIVENRETTAENSPHAAIPDKMRDDMQKISKELFK